VFQTRSSRSSRRVEQSPTRRARRFQRFDVELVDNQSVVLQRALTDEDGRFNMPNVAKGEYVLRVKSPYFAAAWQPFIVTKSSANARCSKPMEVRLETAGRCSSVSKPSSWRNIAITLVDPRP
jgi:hypothetical protein